MTSEAFSAPTWWTDTVWPWGMFTVFHPSQPHHHICLAKEHLCMGSCSIFCFSQGLSWFSVAEIVTVSWDDLKGPLDVRPQDP